MGVVNVKESPSQEGSGSESSDGKSGQHSASRGFTVLVDDPLNDTEFTAQFATGIPRVRDSHPRDPFLRCSRVHVTRPSLILFEVTCEYSAPFYGNGQNPLTQPARVVWQSATEEVDVDEDVKGQPIIDHVLGTAFDPPITRQHSDKVLLVTRNQPTYDPVFYSTFENTVNSLPLAVAGHVMPAGTCLCQPIDGEKMDEDQFSYWSVAFRFHFRRGAPRTTDARAWWARVLNVNYMNRATWRGGLATGRVHLMGEPAAQKVMIKADGTYTDDPTLAHWFEFEIYPSSDFAGLMLF